MPPPSKRLLRLNRRNNHRIDDIGNRRTTAQVVDRLLQTLEDRTNRNRPRGALNGLITDIPGIERREHEDIGMTCDGAVGQR